MSEERDPLPPVDPPEPAPEPAPEVPAAPAAPAAKPAEQPWYRARIAEYAAKLNAAREEIEQLKGAAKPPVVTDATPPPAAPFDRAAFDQAVRAEAQRQAQVNDFTARCNGCVDRGREAFGAAEFDGRVRALRTLVDDKDPDSSSRYNGLLNAAFETGADSELVYELGGDLDRAMRILSMPPMKMAVELARMADGLRGAEPPEAGPQASSNAPPPVRPVGSRGAQHTPVAPDDKDRSDSLSNADWFRRREEQVAARQRQGVRIQ